MSRKVRRCALYTRESTEEGLDQEFNSRDAQCEACAAYVKSQSREGWKAVRTRYDDGGYSGGSMERPALQRLMADIAASKIDIVVVYKIDRLTRALADFARMVETFERHEVSFVSVTQSFNTTSSMGRLTLNVLLSFAQFEREVTGERIRDKIAASKKKGMWMGGGVPLGYDPPAPGSRKLLVNAAEAETVRAIFTAYLELGSVHALERRLRDEGVLSKRRTTRAGKVMGGLPFSRGALFHLLRNRLYLGEIPHKETSYPGQHDAIIDLNLFNAVHAKLDAQARRAGSTRGQVARSPLTGRIFDADGDRMSPTFAYGRGGKLYRYYVSAPLQQGRRRDKNDDAVRRASAAVIEDSFASALTRLLPKPPEDPLALLTRVKIHRENVAAMLPIALRAAIKPRLGSGETVGPDPVEPDRLRLTLPIRLKTRCGKTEVIGGVQPSTRPDPVLLRALRAAHAMLEKDRGGAPTMTAAPDSPHRRRLIRLAFLAPDLQRAILTGRQPKELTLARLMERDIPLAWSEQRRIFGAPASG